MRLMYSLMIIIEIVLLGICAVKSINKKGKLAKIVLSPEYFSGYIRMFRVLI